MPDEATRVGFIGLGSQGGPMAQRIAAAGYPLTVWARRPDAAVPFAQAGAVVADSPRELGRRSDVVAVCVVADRDVEEVLEGPDGVLAGLAPGGVVVIHSTVHPETCRRLAEQVAPNGIGVVDAPVSGGGQAAAANRLLVMVGGEDRDVARCRPVFETFGDPVIHLGGVGRGQMAKLLNNLVFTAQITMALETYGFADRLGIDRAALAEVLAAGSGGSRAAAILAASGFDMTGLRTHARALLRKDVDLSLDVARLRDAQPPEHLVALAEHTLSTLSE